MEFSSPEPADFVNVQSLNHAFLKYLRRPGSGERLRQQLPPTLEQLLAGITDLQIRRLAKTPFLLFSLRERDDAYWSGLFSEDKTADLFTPMQSLSDEAGQIVAATLGYLWQLSRRNPYAVRVASGASQNWCEQLSDCTLLYLLQCAAGRSDLLVLRLADNEELWRKLLGAGISSEQDIRVAAQHCALQTMLTDAQGTAYQRLPAAACGARVPSLQVAEGSNPRSRRKKL